MRMKAPKQLAAARQQRRRRRLRRTGTAGTGDAVPTQRCILAAGGGGRKLGR